MGMKCDAVRGYSFYNDLSDIDALVDGIVEIQRNPPQGADHASTNCRADQPAQIDCAAVA